jgi:hypothetical protein
LLTDDKANDEMAKETAHLGRHGTNHLRRAMQNLDADTRTHAVAITLRASSTVP